MDYISFLKDNFDVELISFIREYGSAKAFPTSNGVGEDYAGETF